jgi:hypothetical protein
MKDGFHDEEQYVGRDGVGEMIVECKEVIVPFFDIGAKKYQLVSLVYLDYGIKHLPEDLEKRYFQLNQQIQDTEIITNQNDPFLSRVLDDRRNNFLMEKDKYTEIEDRIKNIKSYECDMDGIGDKFTQIDNHMKAIQIHQFTDKEIITHIDNKSLSDILDEIIKLLQEHHNTIEELTDEINQKKEEINNIQACTCNHLNRSEIQTKINQINEQIQAR